MQQVAWQAAAEAQDQQAWQVVQQQGIEQQSAYWEEENWVEDWGCTIFTTGSGGEILSNHYWDETTNTWVEYHNDDMIGSVMDDGVSINDTFDGSVTTPDYTGFGWVNGSWQWLGFQA